MSLLSDVTTGGNFRILRMPDGNEKIQLLRMGVCEGDTANCILRLPGGTMVIRRNRQEIAIGSGLAGKIEISVI